MDEERYQEIMDMLTVIWKRIDQLERKINGSIKMADSRAYLNDLKREAEKLGKRD